MIIMPTESATVENNPVTIMPTESATVENNPVTIMPTEVTGMMITTASAPGLKGL